MLLRAICALILLGILVAGLWPFRAPWNEVSWLSQENGLRFGKYGSVVSSSQFKALPPLADSSCSLEIWLKPRRDKASGTILAFYWPENQVAPFALRQSLGDLELLRSSDDPLHRPKRDKLYVDDLFLTHQQPVLVTINGGPSGTTIYADGVLVKKAPNFKFSGQELTGQLVLGNAAATTDEWSGQASGLAVYNRELTAGEVLRHYESWTKGNQTGLVRSDGAVALYLFNEKKGNVVHNHVDPATDLLIPERFFVLHEEFLERPWNEYRPDWNYWEDVGINIAGFIPLGFFFCAYFSERTTKRAVLLTILFGFAVSLTIEVLQAFLPTRDSGMTDLITNTLGTGLGAMIVRHKAIQPALSRIGLSG
jgi:VanZ family protein